MSSASWAPSSQGSTTISSRNNNLAALKAAATSYDDEDTTYDSPTEYYDGYNPTGQTADSETGAAWSTASTGSTSAWNKENE